MIRFSHVIRCLTAAAAILLPVGSVFAQDICAPALSSAMKDVTTKHGVYYFADRLKWQYCGASYASLSETQKQEFGVTYDQLDLDFSDDSASNEVKWSNFCQNYTTRTDRYSNEAITVSNISDKLIEEWGRCIQHTQAFLFIAFDPAASRKHLTVQVNYKGVNPIEFQGVEPYNMTCTHNGLNVGPDTKLPLHTPVLTIACSRSMTTYEIGGLTSEYFPDASVTVKTNSGSSRYEFVSMIDGPAKTKFEAVDHSIADVSVDARDRIATLQTGLELLRTALGGWSAEASQGQTVGAGVTPYAGTSQCPAGHYMIGVSYEGARGSHCDGCVARYTAICKPINR